MHPAPHPRSAIRAALSRLAYENDEVRIATHDLADAGFLVASHRGVFAVGGGGASLLIHGWFFGICRHGDRVYLFENCSHRERSLLLGRIVRLDLCDRALVNPRVLVTGLHANCHQVAVIDGLLCVVDTAGQAIRRYTLEGEAVDVRCPFPIAEPTDRSGAYLHVNSIAKVGERIGLILHNGPVEPERNSEIAWLDADWRVVERRPLPGHHCHDIVPDEQGRLWHSLSREGDVLRSDGVRLHLTSERMTRGIALGPDTMAVGTSTFGPRHLRGTLNGGVVLMDRADLTRRAEIEMIAAPADIIAI